jgi:hypothetical protein
VHTRALLAVCLLTLPLATSPLAVAAEKGKGKTGKAEKPPKNSSSNGSAAKPATPDDARAADAPKRARVHTFSGLDVEGKLKTPQLLYFRSRMKQELDSSTPEKRSFLQELAASADEKGL